MAQKAVTKRRMSRLERKNTLVAYSFLAPNFLGFAIFTLVPVVFSIVLSFVEWNGGAMSNMKWVGLENYETIFKVEKVIEKFAEGSVKTSVYIPSVCAIQLVLQFCLTSQ